MARASTGTQSEAAEQALAVVGMYGDPTVSWSIFLEVELSDPIDPSTMYQRLAATVAAHPGCGLPPDWEVVEEDGWSRALQRIADAPYGPTLPLVRGRATTDGSRVVVAAHHGAVDGLGLLALIAATIGRDLRSRARGISSSPADRPFLRTCVERAKEVAWHSPARFRAEHTAKDAGDWLLSEPLPVKVSTALMVGAAGLALERWGSAPAGARHPFVAAIAASRRAAGEVPTPDRNTAYLRVVDPAAGDVEGNRVLLAHTAPEPDFPSSRVGGLAPLATRLLQSRLGSTVLISNLGLVEGADGVRSMSIYPSASGPSGLALGTMTGGDTAMLTVRARRNAFSEEGARELTGIILEAVGELVG